MRFCHPIVRERNCAGKGSGSVAKYASAATAHGPSNAVSSGGCLVRIRLKGVVWADGLVFVLYT